LRGLTRVFFGLDSYENGTQVLYFQYWRRRKLHEGFIHLLASPRRVGGALNLAVGFNALSLPIPRKFFSAAVVFWELIGSQTLES
jgi:hypothetical protein